MKEGISSSSWKLGDLKKLGDGHISYVAKTGKEDEVVARGPLSLPPMILQFENHYCRMFTSQGKGGCSHLTGGRQRPLALSLRKRGRIRKVLPKTLGSTAHGTLRPRASLGYITGGPPMEGLSLKCTTQVRMEAIKGPTKRESLGRGR
ncbi:hypothetical protein LIER_15110 [Lithospermum erythrorhizon]|uniref:Uncharacterized protein n=1 Tax=Lithospermum erythrorhizon TaxID=34254 RepID=A0AAV3Q6V4_LITER